MGEPTRGISWNVIARAGLPELEGWYRAGGDVFVPRGIFAGVHLGWLDTEGARDPLLRPIEELFFRRLRWFVDFDRKRWFWFARALGVGHFSPSVGPSRWRDTETIRMLYDDRRLPSFLNQWLYDEVKPLSDDVCLGIGGVSAARGRGDQFFFGLRRVR